MPTTSKTGPVANFTKSTSLDTSPKSVVISLFWLGPSAFLTFPVERMIPFSNPILGLPPSKKPMPALLPIERILEIFLQAPLTKTS